MGDNWQGIANLTYSYIGEQFAAGDGDPIPGMLAICCEDVLADITRTSVCSCSVITYWMRTDLSDAAVSEPKSRALLIVRAKSASRLPTILNK
ncbi:MAG: hypothetical protein CM15mP74_33820 [Halieaceae bacterium]|nr:MAG: hypothetical protein CM15mP74_33820 [Halieaceae bacterium]